MIRGDSNPVPRKATTNMLQLNTIGYFLLGLITISLLAAMVVAGFKVAQANPKIAFKIVGGAFIVAFGVAAITGGIVYAVGNSAASQFFGGGSGITLNLPGQP